MKLWIKLALMTALILLASMGFFGVEMIYRSIQYNQEKTIESCEQQLKSTAYAIGRELENGLKEGYSETTKRSYINYIVKKYGASEYILIEDEQQICNLTPFELKNPGDKRWNKEESYSVIQRTGDQYILISGKSVPALGEAEYKLVFVQDISELYRDMQEQALLSILIFMGAVIASVVLVFLVTKKILRPLRELQHAARDISEGKLERRANVSGRDEVGLMAADFNKMADRIEDQVTELSKVSEQRRQMLGSLTHEMKTPMTSIIGYSDTLLHVNLKKGQQE
ncbi:MAG: HAMP domain-containing protein, partial [Lachnospiraceae bacterium]|nr:HAMP domain-containing protein [Lachnospiraceae bacterium]